MKIIQRILVFSVCAWLNISSSAQSMMPDPNGPGYVPPRGFIPNKDTAIQVSIAVLTPIYGRREILKQRPFQAILENEVWTVSGQLPPGKVGGVAEVRLSKRTGEVIRVGHGK